MFLMASILSMVAMATVYSNRGGDSTPPEGEERGPSKDRFHSGVAMYDEAFALALEEVSENIENGEFIAGTPETSYAVELGLGLLYPEA